MELRADQLFSRLGLGRIVDAITEPFRFEYLSPPVRAALAFSFRSWMAGITALYLAFQMQLDQPYWAAASVWIVSQPTPGMALSKGLYRIVGTVIGVVAGVVLVSLFAQTPELFILALALWIGGCTLAANLLRNFRSYGAVLAGFTAAIVALGSYTAPDNAFTIGVARGTCNILGICCAAVFSGLLAPHEAKNQVISRLKGAVGDGARRLAFCLARRPRDETYVIGQRLITEVMALDTEIEYAAAESSSFRIHANRARSILADLFGVISNARALESLEARYKTVLPPVLEEVRESTLALLVSIPRALTDEAGAALVKDIEELRAKLLTFYPEENGQIDDQIAAERFYADRLNETLERIECSLHDLASFHEPWAPEPRMRLDFHRDHLSAWVNAARAFLAVMGAGVFWVETAWSSGSGMLIILTVTISLFSTLPNPGRVALRFLGGVLVATVVAFITTFFIFKNISSWFELGALVLGVIMVPACMLMYFQKTRAFGSAFCLIFITTLRPLNPMDYDVVSFMNNSLATIVGVMFGALSYGLILPYTPLRARRYVMHRIRRGLEIIATRPFDFGKSLPFAGWQSRMYDRIDRLYTTSTAPQGERDEWMKVGLGALDAGNELIRLRALGANPNLPRPAALMVEVVVEKFGHFRARPFEAVESIRSMATEIRECPVPEQRLERLALSRAWGSLEEMNYFFSEYGGQFHF